MSAARLAFLRLFTRTNDVIEAAENYQTQGPSPWSCAQCEGRNEDLAGELKRLKKSGYTPQPFSAEHRLYVAAKNYSKADRAWYDEVNGKTNLSVFKSNALAWSLDPLLDALRRAAKEADIARPARSQKAAWDMTKAALNAANDLECLLNKWPPMELGREKRELLISECKAARKEIGKLARADKTIITDSLFLRFQVMRETFVNFEAAYSSLLAEAEALA